LKYKLEYRFRIKLVGLKNKILNIGKKVDSTREEHHVNGGECSLVLIPKCQIFDVIEIEIN
jgi:hypothetical protein